MIGDVRDLPAGSTIEADICIVGAGPTGLALAREFIAARTTRVVLLESGGLDVEPAAQRLNEGVGTLGLPHQGHGPAGRARAFGGTGRIWAGQCLPLDPIDFEERPWVPFSGWPIPAASIAPYMARAEAFFHVEGEVYDARNYARFGLEAPRFAPDALRPMFTVCTGRVDIGADRMQEFRKSGSVRVLLHATAAGITTDDAGTGAEGISVLAPDRTLRQVRAATVVLCAGGLENARLLLLSNRATGGTGQ
jgi:choline dehydrogenase-like flavoprotein